MMIEQEIRSLAAQGEDLSQLSVIQHVVMTQLCHQFLAEYEMSPDVWQAVNPPSYNPFKYRETPYILT